MKSELLTRGEKSNPLPPKKDQGFRRVVSGIPTGTGTIVEEVDGTVTPNEVEEVECEFCGMSEDCTPTYIARVKEFFCGKWICGLCSEAVKEQVRRTPALTMEEAMESHMAFCEKFNRTTRLNPNLSFAGAMREIARKSSARRISKDACEPRISRTISCRI